MVFQTRPSHSICVLLVHHLKKGKSEGDVFEHISGTNGIFGSVNTALVMQKSNRADKETTLHITVIADDKIIEFNPGSCRWECKVSVDEVEARRLTLEYESDPVVRTVKRLLKDSPVWSGTATDLFNVCFDLTGLPPDKSPDSLGRRIKADAQMLWLRDEIFYFPLAKTVGPVSENILSGEAKNKCSHITAVTSVMVCYLTLYHDKPQVTFVTDNT